MSRIRPCACGCGEVLVNRRATATYYDERCKQRAYRRRLRAAAKAAGVPTVLSFETLQTASPTDSRNGDGASRASATRKRAPSLRISYRKAVDAMWQYPGAEANLRALLSPAARTHLDQEAA